MKEKILKFIKEKPKKDFWMYAFITLFLLNWVSPQVLHFLMPFQIGLIAPDANITQVTGDLSQELANSFLDIMIRMFDAGKNIALNDPFVAKIIYYAVNSAIFSLYMSVIVLCLQLIRYPICKIINGIDKKRHNKPTQIDNKETDK